MSKKKKKSKKGCWLRILYGILIFLLIIGATLLVYYMNSKPIVDTKFQNLINQTFDTAIFTNQVESHKSELGQKLNSCTNSRSICDTAGNIDYAIFCSTDIRVTSNLDLNKFDIANLCSQLNSISLLSKVGTEALIGCLSANRIEWELTATSINYTIIYKVNLSYLTQSIPLQQVPDEMYLTVSANLDLTVTKPVKSVTLTINQLSGEDNEYCLAKIFGALNVGEDVEEKLAYLPMHYIEQINATWQSRYVIIDDFIRIK